MNEKKMMIAYDRKRTSALMVDSQPGAHTGASRKYIPGYSDSNIVYLNTSTGNDANTGASIAQALLTYSAAATAAGSTKKIRLVNSATLTANITKPTEATIGTTSSIASSSLTAPVDVWTQAATPSFSTSLIEAVDYSPSLNKYVAVGASGKVATSPDGNTWTQHTAIGGGNSVFDVIWVQSAHLFFYGGTNGAFGTSPDGITWDESIVSEVAIAATSYNINVVLYSPALSMTVVATNGGTIARSTDNGALWIKAPTILSGDSFLGGCWSDEIGKFFLTTFSGNIYYSEDGSTWTAAATPSFSGDPIYWVTWSAMAGKLVAVGGSFSTPKIAYSTDGITWTQAGTVALSGARANYVAYSTEIGKFVAVGNGGQIAHSSDGDVWTLAGTPSFSTSSISDVVYSCLQGEFIAVGTSGKIAYSTAYATTISASVAGFTIQAVQYSGTLTAYNCTLRQPGTTAALSLDSCRVEYDSHISNNAITSMATLYRGDRHTTCTPASQNAIDMNLDTVGGVWYIYNASATSYERIRDCIIEGGIVASYAVTVGGRSNTRGTSTNVLFGADVTHDNPKFVDTTDYALQFQTNGYARNSLAVGRSALYFNSAGDARDLGAWSYVESAVTYFYSKAAEIYTGFITHELEEVVSEQQGDSGEISVYGNANRLKEAVVLNFPSSREAERAVFQYMRFIDDKTVKLNVNPEWDANPITVVVNGNQSAGVEYLTVDATAVFDGEWLTIAGKKYFIYRASPNKTAATRLILDRPLEDDVSDNDVISANYPSGSGEYQYTAFTKLTLPRIDNTAFEREGWRKGFAVRFVRKASQ